MLKFRLRCTCLQEQIYLLHTLNEAHTCYRCLAKLLPALSRHPDEVVRQFVKLEEFDESSERWVEWKDPDGNTIHDAILQPYQMYRELDGQEVVINLDKYGYFDSVELPGDLEDVLNLRVADERVLPSIKPADGS